MAKSNYVICGCFRCNGQKISCKREREHRRNANAPYAGSRPSAFSSRIQAVNLDSDDDSDSDVNLSTTEDDGSPSAEVNGMDIDIDIDIDIDNAGEPADPSVPVSTQPPDSAPRP
jgi:hypothetical protein